MTRKTLLGFCAALALSAGTLLYAAPAKPKSVIHVITVRWKPSATPEQIQKAIRGADLDEAVRKLQKCNFPTWVAGTRTFRDGVHHFTPGFPERCTAK